MTEPMVKEIIRSLAFNMSVEKIAEAMGVSVDDVNVIAVTRKADVIEERAYCVQKGR